MAAEQRSGKAMDEDTHFGFRTVRTGDKQTLVDDVFHKVAARYDLMNDLMSGGMHRLWKDAAVTMLNPPKQGAGYSVIDVAGGTGDIAARILKAAPGADVTVCDINAAMLREGERRAAERGEAITFIQGSGEDLPFGEGRFDAYTIAFGIRNIPRIERALEEAYRVLKPGGRFVCLEFSAVDIPGLDTLYDTYSFTAIPLLGELVGKDRDAYQYLVESIRKFPDQKRFAAMIGDAGFERVQYRNLSGGIAAIHAAWRL